MSYHSLRGPEPTWLLTRLSAPAQLQSAPFCKEGHTCLSDLTFLPPSDGEADTR